MPNKEISDRLVHQYLRTLESVFCIIHIPSFQEDYTQHWKDPQATDDYFIVQLLLIMAIGTCFCQAPSSSDRSDPQQSLHDRSLQWIYAAQTRLTSPLLKKNLDLRAVQTQCLLILALMTNTQAVGGDLAWISVGALVQSAMAIGLHIRPSHLPVTTLEAEMRRRVWATVLELAVQASLDSGTPPVISCDALDTCESPSNLDDSQITAANQNVPTSQPSTTFTRSSIQPALLKSLPVRFRIAEALSRPNAEISYDSVKSMGANLTAQLRETSELLDSFCFTRPSTFQIHLQDLLSRRFLLVLHAQFVHKAPSDINYHFSRTVCLDSALLLLGPSLSSGAPSREYNNEDDTLSSFNDYAHLRLYGDGLFKNVLITAVMTVCVEFLVQIREDSSPVASSPSRLPLLQAIRDTAALMWQRIRKGETSVKAYVFLVCVLAKIDAFRRRNSLQQKQLTDQAVAEAAKRILEVCSKYLESRVDGMIGSQMSATSGNAASTDQVENLGDWLASRGRKTNGETESQHTITEHSNNTSSTVRESSDPWSFSTWDNDFSFS
jgi:hypothetical protein